MKLVSTDKCLNDAISVAEFRCEFCFNTRRSHGMHYVIEDIVKQLEYEVCDKCYGCSIDMEFV